MDNPFDPTRWRTVAGFALTDITYHRAIADDGRDLPAVRVAFDRPEVRNAFRPHTVDELYRALDHARMTSDVGTVILTGNGPSPKDGGWAFCSGGGGGVIEESIGLMRWRWPHMSAPYALNLAPDGWSP